MIDDNGIMGNLYINDFYTGLLLAFTMKPLTEYLALHYNSASKLTLHMHSVDSEWSGIGDQDIMYNIVVNPLWDHKSCVLECVNCY